jgi:hypothetical protein
LTLLFPVGHARTTRANNIKSKTRSKVEHVFAEQKDRIDLVIRTIGMARATAKIGLAKLVYNIKRLLLMREISNARQNLGVSVRQLRWSIALSGNK